MVYALFRHELFTHKQNSNKIALKQFNPKNKKGTKRDHKTTLCRDDLIGPASQRQTRSMRTKKT